MHKIITLLLLFITCQTFALTTGEPVPKTRTESQIQGKAVKAFEKGKLYVFECWATWCPPCVASIPHLNDLHKKMESKGVIITGVNVWDGEKDSATEKKVKSFVKEQGDKMSYAVSIGGKKFIKDWLEAAGVKGIPHAFVVNGEGVLVWMGHPMELNEKLLGDLLTGTTSATPKAKPTEKKTKSVSGENQTALEKLGQALKTKDWNAAEKILPDAVAACPANQQKDLQESVESIIALGRGETSKTYALYAKAAETELGNAEVQNEIAWDLLTNPQFAGKINISLAEKCAVQAVTLSRGEDPDKLDTLARVRWLQGQKEEAIKLQEKAVSKCTYLTIKEELQATLDSLRKGVLPPGDPISEMTP